MGWRLTLDDIKDLGYRARAKQIIREFDKPRANGHDLYIELQRLLIIDKGETDFVEETKNYPYGMDLPWVGRADQYPNQELDVKEWLNEHVDKSQYLMMPVNCVGKYKDHWRWIYFTNKVDAIRFRLTWYDLLVYPGYG